MNRALKRPYRKRFDPHGLDKWDPKVVRGNVIACGAEVTVTHHYGPFRLIVDGTGNEMSVGRGALRPLTSA